MAGNRIELTYSRPTLGKRLLATFVDFFMFVVVTAVLFAFTNMGVRNLDYYKKNAELRDTLQAESGLYVDGVDLTTYVKKNEGIFTGIRAEKDYLCQQIENFYASETFFTDSERTKVLADYDLRKAEAKHDGADLFTLEEGKMVEIDVNPSWHIEFYFNEVDNYCQPLFVGYEPYINTTRTIYLTAVVELYLTATVSYFVFYLALPLWITKRGRKTMGRALFGIGMVGKDGLNVTPGRFVARAAFSYVVYFFLNIAFLVPLFISAGMLFLSNRNQSLADYVFGTQMVDSTKDDIYLDISDYLERKNSGKKASIENKDFELDNRGL